MAVHLLKKAVNAVTDGGHGSYGELLADVVGWTGTENLGVIQRKVEEVLMGDRGGAVAGRGTDTASGDDRFDGTRRKA